MRSQCCLLSVILLYQINPIYPKPNLMIFLVDDLGWGDLGYTGNPTTSRPNVDKLAKN